MRGIVWGAFFGVAAGLGCASSGGAHDPAGETEGSTATDGNEGTAADESSGGDGSADDGADAACDDLQPVAPLRRLTNFEYDNTVEDLLGDTSRPSSGFVPDDAAEGYSTHAAAAPIGQLQSERYFEAAETAAEAADLSVLLPCSVDASDPSGCGATLIDELGPRAYRRPLTDAEREDLVAVFEEGIATYTFDEAARMVIATLLTSPSFLYRPEFGEAGAPGELVGLQAYELASRLSYFIWGSMPDFDLFRAAAEGRLETLEDVEEQARRMLDDSKARRAVTEFHAQWLLLHNLRSATKDTNVYPTWDDEIRAPLEGETRALLEHIVFDGSGDVRALLTADYSFVDDELAAFYGLAPPGSGSLTRVELDPDRAAGVLTQGSLLAALGKPAQSDPVRRGRFIRERILCEPLPDPPPDVDTTLPEVEEGVSTRERLRQHAQDPTCAACHQLIDPLGFGLEHYDGTGRWRDEDGGAPVDATGEVLGTTNSDGAFDGAVELGQRLARSEDFADCFVRQWFRFAYARAETDSDECTIEALRDTLTAEDHDVREFIVAFVGSRAFRSRLAFDAEGE